MWYEHVLEYYYCTLKRNNMLNATTWRSLENMLSEISQTQKGKYCMFPLT